MGNINTLWWKQNKSHPMLGKSHSHKTKLKLSKSHLGLKHTQATRMKMSKTRMGQKRSPLIGAKISATKRIQWQNPEFARSHLIGLNKRPTSLEKRFMFVIKKYDLPYKYVGDGQFWVNRKNPDFLNINGEKIVIEVANRYHHPDPYKENRIKHFAKYGFKCLVFFEDELQEKHILNNL